MKKLSILLIAALIFLLAACSSGPGWAEQVGEDFAWLPECKYGKVIAISSGEVCSVKIKDNRHADFERYVDDLRSDGFRFYKNGAVSESTDLVDGQSSWRGHKDDVYVQLIFCSDGTENAEILGCNLQIFAYRSDPWAAAEDANVETPAG